MEKVGVWERGRGKLAYGAWLAEQQGFVFLPQARHSYCVFIPSPVREGSTFLVITGVQFFQTELKSVRKVSADANLKKFQPKVL